MGSALYLTPKLAALPRVLPDVIWLESLTFRLVMAGADQSVSSTMRGFCLAGEKAKEIELVNKLTERLRSEPEFFAGFLNVQLASVGSERVQGADVTSFEVQASK